MNQDTTATYSTVYGIHLKCIKKKILVLLIYCCISVLSSFNNDTLMEPDMEVPGRSSDHSALARSPLRVATGDILHRICELG